MIAEIKTMFKDLLREYNSLDAFDANVRNGMESYLDKFCQHTQNLVMGAFAWDKSPQGWDYWQEIDDEWVRRCLAIKA